MVDHLPLPDNPLLDLIEDLAPSGSELFHYPQIVFRHVGFPRPGYHCSAVHPQNIVHFEPLRVCSPFQTCQRSSAMEAKRRDSVTDSPDVPTPACSHATQRSTGFRHPDPHLGAPSAHSLRGLRNVREGWHPTILGRFFLAS